MMTLRISLGVGFYTCGDEFCTLKILSATLWFYFGLFAASVLVSSSVFVFVS